MMTRTLFSRCAPVAIAAAVALPAIPALAQDAATADPVIVLPSDPAPATVPAPEIVLPESTAAATAAPVAIPEAPAPTATTAAREAVVTAPRSTATTPARTPVAASSQRVAASNASVVQPATPVLEEATTTASSEAAPAAAEPTLAAAPVAANTDSNTDELALAGILGALGLVAVGGVAVAASRRRRDRDIVDETYEPMAYEQDDEPIAEEPLVAQPAPVIREPVFTAPPAPAPALSRTQSNGDPVALPAELPDSFEERDALLQKLVAAKPDRANPFTSPRARARRAKLIMQSLGRSFTERKPRIDLSEYTNRWPSLRGWQPATA
jgi:hypothetical protein